MKKIVYIFMFCCACLYNTMASEHSFLSDDIISLTMPQVSVVSKPLTNCGELKQIIEQQEGIPVESIYYKGQSLANHDLLVGAEMGEAYTVVLKKPDAPTVNTFLSLYEFVGQQTTTKQDIVREMEKLIGLYIDHNAVPISE